MGTLRRELLDRILILNAHHLALVLQEHLIIHYNGHRPHQSRHQRPPETATRPARDVTELSDPRSIRRRRVVEGTISEYPPRRFSDHRLDIRAVHRERPEVLAHGVRWVRTGASEPAKVRRRYRRRSWAALEGERISRSGPIACATCAPATFVVKLASCCLCPNGAVRSLTSQRV
ncbi:hypothetical protein [Nonomuraea insulae]|uniref:Integrase catalytic domain-containing protein n=1 Tax=Nonomuraea insulae TaxID=1616787 RepID=A0ABW1CRN5_9ACTN